MAARSTGRVVISFGMAQIGVKLYVSASAESVSFNMISPKNQCRVGQRLFEKLPGSTEDNTLWGEEVSRGDTLKGYEYAKDKFVVFTEEEIANMQAAKKDCLEIVEFVPIDKVDPLRVEKTLYLGPDKGMDKGYQFLYAVLKHKNVAAVGTWVARGKENLVVIRAYQHGLIMHQMFYDTEVRAFEDNCAKIQISPVELAMGSVLVDTLFKPEFDSSKYRDKFVEKVTLAVQIKLGGGTISEVAAPVQSTGMEASLRASLKSMGMDDATIEAMIAKVQADTGTSATPKATPEPVVVAEEKPKATRKPRVKKVASA